MNRRGFIGGSDLYNILKGDWHDLWLVKTGRKQPDDLSHIFKVNLGTYTEQFNLDWLSKDTGLAMPRASEDIEEKKLIIKARSHVGIVEIPIKAKVDAIAEDEEGVQYVVECKHTSSNRSMNDMLESYMPQVQMYMHCHDIDKAYLSVIFGNTHDYCVVDRSKEYLNAVIDRVADFWQFVVDDTEPPQDPAQYKIDWSAIDINGLKLRDASKDNHFTSLASDFVLTQDKAKEHEIVKKELKSLVAADEREVFCDLLTIKRDKRGACRITMN